METEQIWIRFRFENFGYCEGDIEKVTLKKRDAKGVWVRFPARAYGKEFNAWSDLGSFVEIPAMEVLALAVADLLPL